MKSEIGSNFWEYNLKGCRKKNFGGNPKSLIRFFSNPVEMLLKLYVTILSTITKMYYSQHIIVKLKQVHGMKVDGK